ncbi:MAG: TetR/AcrR family transcriptional regulator [Solirubrobacteraceae bacterium]
MKPAKSQASMPINLRGEAGRREVLRRLLEATERLLAAKVPFSQITIQQLSNEAGIARSTFYMHFDDRSALVREMAAIVIDDFHQVIKRIAALGPDPDQEGLYAIMLELVESFRPHERLIPPILATLDGTPEIELMYQVGIARIAATWEAFIRQQPSDRVRDVNIEDLSMVLTRMVEQTVLRGVPGRGAEMRARIARALSQAAWHAIFLDR